MGGSQIPQYLGKKARADLLLAVYAVKLFCFCYFRSTVEGRSHDDTDASGFGIYIYPALFDGFFGRSVGELHEHTGLFTQFGRHVILGIELLDFSGYLDGKIIVVKTGDLFDAAFHIEYSLPIVTYSYTYGSNSSHACNDQVFHIVKVLLKFADY